MGGEKECGGCILVIIVIYLVVELVKFIVNLIVTYFVHILVIGGCVIVGAVFIVNIPRMRAARSSGSNRLQRSIMRRHLKRNMKAELRTQLESDYRKQIQKEMGLKYGQDLADKKRAQDQILHGFVDDLDRQFQEWENDKKTPNESKE